MAQSSGVGTNPAAVDAPGGMGPPAPTTTLNWAPIPSAQITWLNNLSNAGKLWGIPPQILAVIDFAESGGETAGAGINSSGYGGYFGLGTGSYPGGSVTAAQLNANNQASFEAQAQVAASEFASLLTKNGNNPVAAEQAYQTGSPTGTPSEGAKMMAQYTNGLSIKPGTGSASSSSTGSSSSSGASTTGCNPVGPNLPVVGQIFTTCSIARLEAVGLLVAGGIVLFIGVGLIAATMGTGRLRGAAQALPGPAGTAARVTSGQGPQVGRERRQRATAAQSQSDALERTAARGSQTRANRRPIGSLATDSEPL